MYVFDLDGTLSTVGDRLKYLQQDPKDWDSFYEACGEDEVNLPVFDIYQKLHAFGNPVSIITGRRESVRMKTLDWLYRKNIFVTSNRLYLRH